MRELGHVVDEIWAAQLAPRRIKHGNLHSLIEQPRKYAAAIRRAFDSEVYDAVIAQQPQAWMAARDHQSKRRPGLFFTMSQGVETRIWQELSRFRDRYNVPAGRFPHRLLTQPLQKRLGRQWDRAVRFSTGVIVQHSQDRDYLCRHHGASESAVHVSASGLAVEFLRPPLQELDDRRRRRILYVGQNAFYKGVDCLIEIVSRVLRANRRAEFSWVCGASDHGQIRARFSADLRPRIHLHPWTDQASLVEMLDSHGIFLFPTLAEGFAKAPLEAMSRGMIVIASDCCGMKDYMAQLPLQLCAVGDVEQFVNRVNVALSGACDSSIPLAVESARRYTWVRTASQTIEFVKQKLEM